ncbi:MAG: hypothetical protein UR34_C0002G0020 [candidate division WS6 bacterium GW2011_GWC1_33_20]|uniref:Uncharacterized protein n=1 Tax=candidate division WS6 bacterium GW2011_GWC1_33_20 TaxID=1619089 RepID=A0A0G0CM92_9BACT|nr:MAG: hypothetical protein UR34_C0002G0020 [candidate division WS6 bacterium GW2011_GWC1_33_20]KKP44634.1 MAG: hypothetical protein UR36_C0015G0009 [candidate division WS6 bacterium GW2011_GWF1_33_233]KKP54268.1 MAG: hypothetical protein UR45_C0020G0008 [candidate division WS6 bacterium GW2011_WS6_33_547]KKP56208.1 MAG: hypothetical protein UR49_C0017G0015 [candidate division WS6 bacterium GW2011_GWF2_33_92]KKP82567.1 MAG: hypothetical protein UR84_C0002G0054 [candidate division WS6 bacterium
MNLINNITNNWSMYEKNMEIFLLLSILGISLLVIYSATKNKQLLILSTLSFIVAAIFNVMGIYIVSLFKIPITEIFRIIPIITSILLVSNLGILVGFYISKKDMKGFNISFIMKEYFSDSVKQTIFLLLLGLSTLLFVSVQTEAVIAISILSTIAGVWSLYWISRYILK